MSNEQIILKKLENCYEQRLIQADCTQETLNVLYDAISLIKDYIAIGTVKECRNMNNSKDCMAIFDCVDDKEESYTVIYGDGNTEVFFSDVDASAFAESVGGTVYIVNKELKKIIDESMKGN